MGWPGANAIKQEKGGSCTTGSISKLSHIDYKKVVYRSCQSLSINTSQRQKKHTKNLLPWSPCSHLQDLKPFHGITDQLRLEGASGDCVAQRSKHGQQDSPEERRFVPASVLPSAEGISVLPLFFFSQNSIMFKHIFSNHFYPVSVNSQALCCTSQSLCFSVCSNTGFLCPIQQFSGQHHQYCKNITVQGNRWSGRVCKYLKITTFGVGIASVSVNNFHSYSK